MAVAHNIDNACHTLDESAETATLVRDGVETSAKKTGHPSQDLVNTQKELSKMYSELDERSISLRGDRADRVRLVRMLTRLSRQKFSKVHSIPYGSLQNWEDGKYGGLTKTGAPRIKEAFEKEGIFCSIEWLLYGTGAQPYVSAAKFLERMQIKPATDTASPEKRAENESLLLQEELNFFRHNNPNGIDMVVPDDSMAPQFKEGDIVAGRKQNVDDIAQLIGEICIVQTADNQRLLRVLEMGSQSGRFNLSCLNKQSNNSMRIENAKLFHVARVLWIRRRTKK